MRSTEASGLDALRLTSALLNRVRLADPVAGVWEAADVQWWWRTPRASDGMGQRFWLDDQGPLAAAPLTAWPRGWGLDPIVLPGAPVGLMRTVVVDTITLADAMGLRPIETLVRDDDAALTEVLRDHGFRPIDDHGGITWLNAADRPAVAPPADGFTLVDRATHSVGRHPMSGRNGEDVERRLGQVPLYDRSLDLAIQTPAGEAAGYALFWFDPVTRVGLVEPMRVEDAWQRRGLARSLLTEGLDRLARRGATRLKVGWGSPPGRALYLGAGFRQTSSTTTWVRS